MKKALTIIGIIAGAVLLLAAVNFAPMLSRKTPGMESYVSHGIQVFATERDRDEVDRIAARISERSRAITSALGSESAHDLSVIIYPSRKALHRKTIGLIGMLLPDWYIGQNTRDFVLITSPGNPGPAHSRESIEQAAVHEYVHLVTDRRNESLGYWLKEGIALYLAEQVPSLSSIEASRGITWEEFSNPSALQFAEVGGYTLAYTLVEFIDQTYGWDSVVALTDPEATFESALGVSERELFERWTAGLRPI